MQRMAPVDRAITLGAQAKALEAKIFFCKSASSWTAIYPASLLRKYAWCKAEEPLRAINALPLICPILLINEGNLRKPSD